MQPAPARTTYENLAILFQEPLTVITRLRANRQVVRDADSFRMHLRAGLTAAEQEASRRGYNGEDIRVAVFAIVAFLDESVLNSQNPYFADWARKPMQEELFGVHVAGEIFFRNVDRLLAQPDSPHLEELLEIYELCLRLGFRGRYSSSMGGEVRSIASQIAEKRRRIRSVNPTLSPNWAPSQEAVMAPPDPWARRLKLAAIGTTGAAILLFAIYKLMLYSSSSALQTILTQHQI